MWAIPTGTSSALKKKNQIKESQYMVSYPELGSDPPIGSGRESGRDRVRGREDDEVGLGRVPDECLKHSSYTLV